MQGKDNSAENVYPVKNVLQIDVRVFNISAFTTWGRGDHCEN
jgi:hypothetical protein